MRSHEAKERFRFARTLYVDRQFADALAVLEELREVFDDYPDLHYLRARCLGKLKRADELRAVADILTTRFNDPRGAEIHTWFVRRPKHDPQISDIATPATPSEFPTPAPAAASSEEELPSAEILPDEPAAEPEPIDAPSSPPEPAPDESSPPVQAAVEAVPKPCVGDEPPAETAPAAPIPAQPRRKSRFALAALALIAIAGIGALLVAHDAPVGSDESPTTTSRETATAMAALRTPDSTSTAPLPTQQRPSATEPRWASQVDFHPDPAGGFRREVRALDEPADWGDLLLAESLTRSAPSPAWKIDIPFEFPFGGVEWSAAFVNLHGNITFGYAEADAWPERESGDHATPRGIAAAVDSRAAAGRERMIAPLWLQRDLDSCRVYATPRDDSLTITWRDADALAAATLFADGRIQFRYNRPQLSHGFSGVFSGIAWAGESLADVADPEDVLDPNVDITAFQIDDAPSVIQFTLTMRAGIPTTVSSGELIHRITLDTPNGPRQFGVTVTNEPRGWIDWADAPRILGYEREGNRLYFYLSKSLMQGFDEITAHAEVVWKGFEGLYDRVDDPPMVDLAPFLRTNGENEFFAAGPRSLGSIYHVHE